MGATIIKKLNNLDEVVSFVKLLTDRLVFNPKEQCYNDKEFGLYWNGVSIEYKDTKFLVSTRFTK